MSDIGDDNLAMQVPILELRIRELENKLANRPANAPGGFNVGKYDGSKDFHRFLREFNLLATAQNWAPTDCVRFLPLYLEGEAKEIYTNLGPGKKNNWRDLTAAMAEGTKKRDGPIWARRALAKLKLTHESVTEYANKIKDLVDVATAGDDYKDPAREKEYVHYFMNGLPTNIKRKLFFMDTPINLSDAIQKTKNILQIKEEIEHEDQSNDLKIQIAELKEQVNAISLQDKRKKDDMGNQGQGYTNDGRNNWGKNRGRGNFPGRRPYRGRGGQQFSNFYRNDQFMGRGPRNPNFEPLGRNRPWNNANFGGDQRWQGNFDQRRGNFRGRARGNDRYRINMVGNDEQTPSTSRKSPTPSLAFLTICAIFCLIFGLTSAQYQICTERVAMTPITLPNVTDCSIPEFERAVEREITLFLPVRLPKQFPIYKCHQKIVKICTESFFIIQEEKKSGDYPEGD